MGPSPHLWFLHAKQRLLDQNYKSLCVPYLTCRFVHAKHAVVQAQNDRSYLGLIETCYSAPDVFVLHEKSTGEGRNQYTLFILVLSTQLFVHKTTDEVWDPYRLVCLVLKSLFCMHKMTGHVRDP